MTYDKRMEKRGIIRSFEEWKLLRYIRNLFSHDYPETDNEKAETLNIAYSNTLNLVSTIDSVINYMKEKGYFPMGEFPCLIKKN